MKRLHEQRQGQKGFTLIEIIAVLVILGVLAAVALPRYFDLETQARSRAVAGAVAEVQARINQVFAQRLLDSTVVATATQTKCAVALSGLTTANLDTANMGDFTVTITGTPASGADVTMTVAFQGTTYTPGTAPIANVNPPVYPTCN